jgi:hypothetical protein
MRHENAIGGNYPTVLALDLGNPFGWAVNIGRDIHGGVEKFVKAKEESEAQRWLNDSIALLRPSCIVFENAPFQQGHAAQTWHSQRGIMAAVCQGYGLLYEGIAVGTIKKHITGSGKFSKPKRKSDPEYKMLTGLRERYKIEATDWNEADAIGVLLTALETGVVEREGE